ncbi:hypothetical protein WJX72_005601 [[Myrmecia] bisecta]|uniref:25S rRNA (uridine-N(3))-methyltransferase BMT5-like domain-containing protein n=1 Tax=[Myrmecia] bisecta TaxID=41462 RepID=A0AAW1Q3Y6_9CHLO
MKHKKRERRLAARRQAKQLGANTTANRKADSKQKPKLKLKHKQRHSPAELFTDAQHILLVGEGNFSFARAVVRNLTGQGAGIVATGYDSPDVLEQKYEEGDNPVSSILQELLAAGVTVKCNIDATSLKKSLMANKKSGGLKVADLAFDRVVFNFPHIGLGIKDQDVNVRKNQALLASFFQSSCEVLRPDGEIHVTLKQGKPYDLWNVVGVAHQATGGLLRLKASFKFDPSHWPGYAHRRTLGYKEGMSASGNEEVAGRSRTYVFAPSQPAPGQAGCSPKQARPRAGKRQRAASDSDSGSD